MELLYSNNFNIDFLIKNFLIIIIITILWNEIKLSAQYEFDSWNININHVEILIINIGNIKLY